MVGVPVMDTAAWRRLSVIALALVGGTTVALVSMLVARESSVPATVSAPQVVSAQSDPTAGELHNAVASERTAPARTRVYSPVDVRTLADARANGDAPQAAQTAVEEDARESKPSDEPLAAARTPIPQPSVLVTSIQPAPPRVAPPPPTRELATRSAPSQRRESTRAVTPTQRLPERSANTQAALSRAPVSTIEPAIPRPVPVDPPRVERRDAVSDLDAAWARREQWMRERLRQR